jgi:SPP1 gp7 family putative phage head morphogenesis protein
MTNGEYWKQQFEDIENDMFRVSFSYAQEQAGILDIANAKIDKEINALYGQYADEDGYISMQDARKYLSQKELKSFRHDVDDYIRMATDNPNSLEVSALSARTRISRLEALKARTAMYINQAYADVEANMKSGLSAVMRETNLRDVYEIQTGTGKYEPFEQIDKKSIDRALSRPWLSDGKTFSNRIWDQQDKLINTVQREMVNGFISGVNPQGMTSAIEDEFDVAKHVASRLALTECAYFSSEASKDSYKELGVKQYQILATLDDRTSDICQDEDGKIYNVSEYSPGDTAPPFHPNCRSTTVPVVNNLVVGRDETRAVRDPETGKTKQLDGKLTYTEWNAAYVTHEVP